MDAGLQPLSFLYPGPAGLAVCGHSLLPAVPDNEIKEKIRIKEEYVRTKKVYVLLVLIKTASW